MITVQGLTYRYNKHFQLSFPALKLERGGACLILGQSGCGKTTFLHLLGGLRRIQEGSVSIRDTAIESLDDRALDHFRGRNIGFIFQQPHLIRALTVEENLLLAQYLAGKSRDGKRVAETLHALDIDKLRKSHINQLSQGQAQRVAIARAVINHPEVVLADEPTSSLDDENCERVIDLLLTAIKINDSSLIITTHDKRLKDKIPHQLTLTRT